MSIFMNFFTWIFKNYMEIRWSICFTFFIYLQFFSSLCFHSSLIFLFKFILTINFVSLYIRLPHLISWCSQILFLKGIFTIFNQNILEYFNPYHSSRYQWICINFKMTCWMEILGLFVKEITGVIMLKSQ